MPHQVYSMAIRDARIITFAAENLRSLVWDCDELVDWAGGGVRFTLDGQKTSLSRRYAYGFDSAVADEGDAVIFTRSETKGLVLRNGEILREIDRSFYCANAFDYPIALFRLGNGRRVLAHCPRETGRLDIEDFATGELLTASASRTPQDNFHGRLIASPDGRYLLSAGWAWQPYDDLLIFDVEHALTDPSHLDSAGILPALWSEMGASAAFAADSRLIVGINIDGEDRGSEGHTCLHVFDLDTRSAIAAIPSKGPLGRLMAVGNAHVLNLYSHPQLLDLRTGELVRAWPDIACDSQISATRAKDMPFAHVAIDVENMRCAIGFGDRITIMQFEA